MKRYKKPCDIEQSLISSLRDKGYKLTPQRLEIIRFLSKDLSHPGAMDIFNRIRKKLPQISLSTVYYTLDILKKEGLIRELEFHDRDNRYDITVSNHLNLICMNCGKIEDFEGELPVSSDIVKKKTGFKPLNMRFEYYGYCKECKARK